jgi:tRNA (guanine-N7-)-methyltransferase
MDLLTKILARAGRISLLFFSRTGSSTLARIKVRQHVNPLGIKYQQPIVWPDWAQIYARPELPLHIDIGCAWGRFVLKMAEVQPEWNFLGIEIREPLVTEANRIRDDRHLPNLHYVFANINISLASLLTSLPAGSCQRISIQYPDPCFKTRHAKRRMVQPELVSVLAENLSLGTEIFLQSDLEWVAQEMVNRFAENSAFQRQNTEWLSENPLPVQTEREIATLKRDLPVHRSIFHRI